MLLVDCWRFRRDEMACVEEDIEKDARSKSDVAAERTLLRDERGKGAIC
jgi:hypothetical protein